MLLVQLCFLACREAFSTPSKAMKHPPQSDIFGGGIDPSIRSWPTAVKRGLRQKCPACGTGKILYSYTKVKDTCASCGLALAGHQADDMPPYVTMLISGHIIIPLTLYFERSLDPPMGLQFLIWGPALLGLTFLAFAEGQRRYYWLAMGS